MSKIIFDKCIYQPSVELPKLYVEFPKLYHHFQFIFFIESSAEDSLTHFCITT